MSESTSDDEQDGGDHDEDEEQDENDQGDDNYCEAPGTRLSLILVNVLSSSLLAIILHHQLVHQ